MLPIASCLGKCVPSILACSSLCISTTHCPFPLLTAPSFPQLLAISRQLSIMGGRR